MISLCFDEFYSSGNDFVFKISEDNRRRPIIYFWSTKTAVLGYDVVKPIGANQPEELKHPFVYVAELHWELPDWCKKVDDEPLVVPPPPVLEALADKRAILLLNYAQEGRVHYDPDEPDSVSVFDKLEKLAVELDLPPEQLWFVTGNLDGQSELDQWKVAKGVVSEAFTFRTCEISTYGIGRVAYESYHNSRGLQHMVSPGFAFPDQKCASWKQAKISVVERKFTAPGFGVVGGLPEPKWNFGSLSRNFRFHRWWILESLFDAEILHKGLISFPQLGVEQLEFVFKEPIPRDLLSLIESLPRFIDVEWVLSAPANFNSQNIAAVTLPPIELNFDCAFELINETSYDGSTLVTEKSIKGIYGRGPFAVNGPRGVITYLNSLGVETWSKYFDESYDQVPDKIEENGRSARFNTMIGAVLPVISNDDEVRRICKDSAKQRDGNLKWLLGAKKPWETILDELEETLSQL